MTTETTEKPDTEASLYVSAVAAHLGGLAPDERAEVLEDLAQHIEEIAAEPGGPSLTVRLGQPADYAAELLGAAGVVVDAKASGGLVERVAQVGNRIKATRVATEVLRRWPAWRPAWLWVRGYLAVSLLAAFANRSFPGFPIPRLFGTPILSVAAIAGAVYLSVRLGRRPWGPFMRLAWTGANVTLVVFALVLAAATQRRSFTEASYPEWAPSVVDSCLRNGDGQAITNLYAYDPDGRLLDTVLLYDASGRPIDNLCPEMDAEGRQLETQYRRDANGAAVINAFPRTQTAIDTDGSGFPDSFPAGRETVKPPAVVIPRLGPTPTTTLVAPTTTAPPPATTGPGVEPPAPASPE